MSNRSAIRALVPGSQIARCQNDVVFVAMVSHVEDLQLRGESVDKKGAQGGEKITDSKSPGDM